MAGSRRRKGVPSVPAAVLLLARRLSMVHAGSVSPAFMLAGGRDVVGGVQIVQRERRSLAPTLSTATRYGAKSPPGRLVGGSEGVQIPSVSVLLHWNGGVAVFIVFWEGSTYLSRTRQQLYVVLAGVEGGRYLSSAFRRRAPCMPSPSRSPRRCVNADIVR